MRPYPAKTTSEISSVTAASRLPFHRRLLALWAYAALSLALVGCGEISRLIAPVRPAAPQLAALPDQAPPYLPPPAAPRLDYTGRVGVTHWDGRYHFTGRPILEEGADRIWDMGARVIKLELEVSGKYRAEYPFNHVWAEYATVRDLAASPDYTAVINRPWRWVNFQIDVSQNVVPVVWCDGMSEREIEAERAAFYDLTRYLLEQYRHSGISFLLDHWEGDNALDRNPCYPDGGGGADWTVRDGMVKWLSARQAGIEQARAEVGEHGVHVYGGAECNSTPYHEWPPGAGSQCGANVLPYIDPPPDLCGLSAYRDLASTDMTADIAWMHERCNAARKKPSPLAPHNIYIAELGAAGNEVGDEVQLAITRAQVDSALANGAALVLYWQLFSNECLAGCPHTPVRDGDVRGFWLIRPEPYESGGTPTPTYHWLAEVLADNRTTATPQAAPAQFALVARASGRCVESGAVVQQWGCDAARSGQIWSLADAGDQRVLLVDTATGQPLGVSDDGVSLTTQTTAPSQAWQLVGVPGAGGYFAFDDGAGRCLTLSGSYTDGEPLRLAPCHQGNTQMFWLREYVAP